MKKTDKERAIYLTQLGISYAERTTTGNLAHNRAGMKGCFEQILELLTKSDRPKKKC